METGHHAAASERHLIFGVDEEDHAYVIILGLILVGIAVLACCYCKVWDPTFIWCKKKCIKYCTCEPIPPPPPPREERRPEEREHWYLHRTLAIDTKDKEELGPIGNGGKGLRGGWYGARNGGFGADTGRRVEEV